MKARHAINHANHARYKISQFGVEFRMVMPLISNWYIDIQADILYIYIYSIYSGSHIFETKDERQSGRLQPCTIDYLLTINWLVLIFARASLFEPRVIATSFRAIIKKSSSQFGSNNHLQSPLSHGQKSDLSCEFATALRGPIDFIYINIDRIISPILHILHNGRKSYCIKRVTNTALYFRNNINKNGEKLG